MIYQYVQHERAFYSQTDCSLQVFYIKVRCNWVSGYLKNGDKARRDVCRKSQFYGGSDK